jgi:hypothetical protein
VGPEYRIEDLYRLTLIILRVVKLHGWENTCRSGNRKGEGVVGG